MVFDKRKKIFIILSGMITLSLMVSYFSYIVFMKVNKKFHSVVTQNFASLENLDSRTKNLETLFQAQMALINAHKAENSLARDLIIDNFEKLNAKVDSQTMTKMSIEKLAGTKSSIDKLTDINADVNKSVANLRIEMANALMTEKVEQLIKNLTTDEEKVIAIATWISSHIGNVASKNPRLADIESNTNANAYDFFLSRRALCAGRAELFVEMLNAINIRAQRYNFYNYPEYGSSHACAQAFYNGGWHFFDVTYAGYFKKKNKILAIDEIIKEAKNNSHLKYLVVLPSSIDCWGTIEAGKVDNYKRMAVNFTREALVNAKSHGFLGDTISLETVITPNKFQKNKYEIGFTKGSYFELEKDAVKDGLSAYIGVIGTKHDNFFHQWSFQKLEHKSYTMKFHVYNRTAQNLKFWAKAENATIIKGDHYNNEDVWEITFKPISDNAKIIVGYDNYNHNSNNHGLFLDKIEIEAQ